jgi:hypothetical protein
MLPGQFNDGLDSGISGGERRLMAAILSDGVEAYISHSISTHPKYKDKKSDAQDWVDTKDYAYVFSFDNVCNCLGIDADYLRLGLARYIETVRSNRKNGQALGEVWKKIRRPRK